MNTVNDKDLLACNSWIENYPFIFNSELEALREALPKESKLSGLEVGLGTRRYTAAIGIKEEVEAPETVCKTALSYGVVIRTAVAEKLPYHDLRFDFVLMVYPICPFERLDKAFHEANRVLKNNGALIVGFIDKESLIGKYFEAHKSKYEFCTDGNLYTVDRILSELTNAGFHHYTLRQTLFGELDTINSIQPSLHGYGKGSFVVIKAHKEFSKVA